MSARGVAAAAAWLLVLAGQAPAAVEIQWWHAMQGERGRQLERLVNDFNASQSEYEIVPVYKGSYNETLAAAIVALRTRQHPPIVQVVEVATATMMAAKGAVYPVYQLMRDQGEDFDPAAYLPAISSYYGDLAGNMLSFPFNSSSPILYFNKDQFQAVGLDPEKPPQTWGDMETAARHERQRLWWPRHRAHDQQRGCDAPHRRFGRMAEDENLRLRRARQPGGNEVSLERMRHVSRLVRDPHQHPGQRQVRGRLRHAAVLGRRGRRAAKFHHRRRHAVGAEGADRGRISGRGALLCLPVAARPAGLVAPEHRLHADHPQALRYVAGAGLLRPQPRHRHRHRAAHATPAYRQLPRPAPRLVSAHPRRDRG